ncbi:peptidoglycan-associated lipoprotein Pal [Candidatus Pandoraea novymonadis]|uniref:Peptidoglycan-associated lipoprotein n=1 Tax=Candidatus Pandoraea novymonadis TaxID=1808959 RepID=A0ABX5FG35_9BURK|nr:peptidoglycan-associated lipoprotein Pal [Candidatus Pandoraea novymonadis]PSB92281.1 Peptidoglycan-associated lipoprotein [Candidatus Pandoraea novymonadis]
MNALLRHIFSIAIFIAITGCSSSVMLDEQPVIKKGQFKTGALSDTSIHPSKNLSINDRNGLSAKHSVYFDFDSYIIKNDYKLMLEKHASYLTNNHNRRIIIQGHTDERGTSEYNLALGQKRAKAVVRWLTLLGVDDNQLEAVSFGKEKPRTAAQDEASYAENRRADIVY